MKKTGQLVAALATTFAAVVVISGMTRAASVVAFPSVTGTGSLEATTGPNAAGTIASVAGYFSPGDSGGGQFYNLGTASTFCPGYFGSYSLNSTPSTTVSGLTLSSNPIVGEYISGSGIQPGAQVASVVSATQITMTLPSTGLASGSLTISSSNGGTLIVDMQTGGPQCWQKMDYRGDPHEWGAVGDAVNDDTGALQNWLGAYGNPSSSSHVLTNFGPWNALVPANYQVTGPLSCPANALIQGLGTQTDGPSPLVRIVAARQKNQLGKTFNGSYVLIMNDHCRLSGMTIDGGGIQLTGTTTPSSHVITNLDTTNIQLNDVVTAADLPAGTTVSTINSGGTCSSNCVVVNNLPTSSTQNSELISFNGPIAVQVAGSRDTIDGHSLIENGFNNVYCPKSAQYGLELKDSQFYGSGSDNIELPGDHTSGCANVRVTGNVIYNSGGSGVVFNYDDITVSDNAIAQSAGIGIDLTGANKVTVGGNVLDDNGKGFAGGAAVEIKNTTIATICNNHITGNGEYSANPAQIHFGGTDDEIDLCGNVYATEQQAGDATLKPLYTYDTDSGTILTNSHLYETPTPGGEGIYSTSALAILPTLLVPQVVPSQINGFTLSNSGVSGAQLAAGTAADSSGSVLLQNAASCTVNLAGSTGQGGLDAGSLSANTTYFFFTIAQSSGIYPGSTQNCIASTSSAPTFRNTSSGPYDLVMSCCRFG